MKKNTGFPPKKFERKIIEGYIKLKNVQLHLRFIHVNFASDEQKGSLQGLRRSP